MRTPGHERNRVTRLSTLPGGVLTTTNGVSGTAVHYFEVQSGDDLVTSIQISWADATASAAIVLQGTNFDSNEADILAADTFYWVTVPVTITGPVASALGSTLVDVSNLGLKRLRVKVTAAANTTFYLRTHGKH